MFKLAFGQRTTVRMSTCGQVVKMSVVAEIVLWLSPHMTLLPPARLLLWCCAVELNGEMKSATSREQWSRKNRDLNHYITTTTHHDSTITEHNLTCPQECYITWPAIGPLSRENFANTLFPCAKKALTVKMFTTFHNLSNSWKLSFMWFWMVHLHMVGALQRYYSSRVGKHTRCDKFTQHMGRWLQNIYDTLQSQWMLGCGKPTKQISRTDEWCATGTIHPQVAFGITYFC